MLFIYGDYKLRCKSLIFRSCRNSPDLVKGIGKFCFAQRNGFTGAVVIVYGKRSAFRVYGLPLHIDGFGGKPGHGNRFDGSGGHFDRDHLIGNLAAIGKMNPLNTNLVNIQFRQHGVGNIRGDLETVPIGDFYRGPGQIRQQALADLRILGRCQKLYVLHCLSLPVV